MKKTMFLSFGLLGWLAQSASAQSLLATTNDLAQLSGGTLSSSFYSANLNVNGIGNTSNPGGSGGIGSIQLTLAGGWGGISDIGGAGSQAFLSAIDPGALAPYSAGSGYGPGTLTAYSGTMSFDVFEGNITDWHQFGLLFNYSGTYSGQFGSATSFTGADGNTWVKYTIPYTINAVNAALGYFDLQVLENTAGDVAGETIYVDNFQVTPAPEPTTTALAGMGSAALLLFFRRRAVC